MKDPIGFERTRRKFLGVAASHLVALGSDGAVGFLALADALEDDQLKHSFIIRGYEAAGIAPDTAMDNRELAASLLESLLQK